MSIYRDYFDGISPHTSDEGFEKSVTAHAERARPKIRFTASAAAAAAVLTLFAATASAFCGFGITEAVRSLFGDKDNITESAVADMTVTNAENSFNDLDISAAGAFTDKNFTVIFLDIARTDGDIFDCAPRSITDSSGNELIYPDGNTRSDRPRYWFGAKKALLTYFDGSGVYACTQELNAKNIAEGAICCYTLNDGSDLDGHITQAVCIDTAKASEGQDGLVCGRISLELENFSGERVMGKYSSDGSYVLAYGAPILDMKGCFSLEADIMGCEAPSRDISFEKTAYVRCYPYTDDYAELKEKSRDLDFNVTLLSITPFSVSLALERETPEETFYVERYPSLGSVIMKDGREIPFGDYDFPAVISQTGNIRHLSFYDSGDKWVFEGDIMLPEAIDINEVRAVRIGSTEFELD